MNTRRPVASVAIKVTLTIALLLLLYWRVHFLAIGATLQQLSFGNWFSYLLLFLCACLIAAIKWKILLRHQKLKRLLQLNFIGQYYAILLPGQIAGEAIKAYRLGKGRADAERIVASVILDKITGFLGLLVVAIYGISCSGVAMKKQILITLLAGFILLLCGLFSLHLPGWLWLLNTVERTGPRRAKVANRFRRLLEAWRSYVEAPVLMLVSVLTGAVFQLAAVWINFRVGRELGINIPFSDWCWVFGIVSIVVAFPFTVAGIGLREGSFIGTLSILGASSERAVAQSLVVFSLILAGAAIGGVMEWTRLRTLRAPSSSGPAPLDSTNLTCQ